MLKPHAQSLLTKLAIALLAFAAGAGLVAWVTLQPSHLSALKAGYVASEARQPRLLHDAGHGRELDEGVQ